MNFKLFYSSTDNLKILSGDNYSANVLQHLSNEELEALKSLLTNCNLVMQKSGKWNSVVTVEKRFM